MGTVRRTREVERHSSCNQCTNGKVNGQPCSACGGSGSVVVVDTEVYYEDDGK